MGCNLLVNLHSHGISAINVLLCNVALAFGLLQMALNRFPLHFIPTQIFLKKYNTTDDDDDDESGVMLGGHVRAVFTLVTVIFIGCVSVTLDSFREIPLWRLQSVSQSAMLNDDSSSVASADAKATDVDAVAAAATTTTPIITNSTEQSALNERLQAPDAAINRTTSYGALSNQTGSSHLDVPKTIVSMNHNKSNLK